MNIKWADLEQTVIVINDTVSLTYPTQSRFKAMIEEWLNSNQIEGFTKSEKEEIIADREEAKALSYLKSTQQYSLVNKDDPDMTIPDDIKAKRQAARGKLR